MICIIRDLSWFFMCITKSKNLIKGGTPDKRAKTNKHTCTHVGRKHPRMAREDAPHSNRGKTCIVDRKKKKKPYIFKVEFNLF